VPTFREEVARHLAESWRATPGDSKPIVSADWKFVWSLTKAVGKKDGVPLGPGDVVISDIYSGGFWVDVPKPTKHSAVSQFPDDPQNLARATLEVTERFLPALRKSGAHIVVLTYVPRFVERDCGEPKLAAEIRTALTREGRTLVEKVDREVENAENYPEVVHVTNRLLGIEP
jgi:hypothetical protein